MKTYNPLLLFLLTFNIGVSQNINELKAINTDIWYPFTKAYETYDADLFKSLHDSNLIRVSGNQKSIISFDAYMSGFKNRWQSKNRKQTISFRFIERIVSDNLASERGIYKLTVDLDSDSEQSYYGQFHVIHKKINGKWKLILDYDSSENNTINEESYLKASEITKN